MKGLLRAFLDVRRGEWLTVSLLFSNLFLIVMSYYTVKSIRGALVIQEIGADVLPYIWILGVFVLGLFIGFYSRLIDRYSRAWVMAITGAFFILSLLGMRWLLGLKYPGLTALFYIWSDVYSVVMVEQLWSYANAIYRYREASRLYGIIGSGGILGAAAGGGAVSWLVPHIGTANMPFVCAAIVAVLIVSFFILHHITGTQTSLKEDLPQEKGWKPDLVSSFRIVGKSRYLTWMAIALVLTQVVSTLIDFQFSKVVETSVSGLDLKSIFFGKFYFWQNLVGFLLMIFVATPVNKYLGALAGLLVLPIVNSVGIIAFLLMPLPMMVFLLKLFDKSINYSVYRASKEMLYTSTGSRDNYKAKAAIDMFGYRASKIAGSALIIPCMAYFSVGFLNFVDLGLIVVLVFAIFKIGHERRDLAPWSESAQTVDPGQTLAKA